MAVQKKAKAPEPAGESAPMWIVSFADLVTLMMSFFVVLYAMKQGGEKQQMDTMAAIKATFDPAYEPPQDANPDAVMEIQLKLAQTNDAARVTVWQVVPALLRAVLEESAAGGARPRLRESRPAM